MDPDGRLKATLDETFNFKYLDRIPSIYPWLDTDDLLLIGIILLDAVDESNDLVWWADMRFACNKDEEDESR